MNGSINNVDFWNMPAMKYFAPPASWSDEKKQDTARSRIFSGDWYGSRKRDGSWWMFIKDEDGNMMLRGRSKGVNGEYPDKIEWVPHLNTFFNSMPNGTVFLGELYLPSKEQSRYVTTILGCLQEKAIERQEKEEALTYYIFDVLAYDGEILYNKPFVERISKLDWLYTMIAHINVEWARYINGQELWDMLQDILASGGEGMVITEANCTYQPDKRPTNGTLKVKKELKQSIDAFFTGKIAPPTKEYNGKEIETWKYWINSVTDERLPTESYANEYYNKFINHEAILPVTKPYYYNWAGSLEIGVYDENKIVPIGLLSGVTDELKEHWADYKGKVIEVAAMQLEKDTHALRHGKMIGFREDKRAEDCTIDQLK